MPDFLDPSFVPHGRLARGGSGMTVAVKDLFDWAGVPTGAGNPDWLKSHAVPNADAGVLSTLLAAGLRLTGKTVTDELAYSIHGDNVHYGTPLNPAAPDRVPGGSSSGSASAVASGLVEAALGTDTGGSVRVPAAYCGLFGLRTTHGAVDRSGLVPLAPSFDTVGWFGRSPAPVARLADLLLSPHPVVWRAVATLPLPGIADEPTTLAVAATVERLGLPQFSLDEVFEAFGGLETLRRVYATLQGFEAWETHGEWITAHKPRFSDAVAQRFQAASRVTADEAATAQAAMEAFREALRGALGDHTVLILPATEGPAPLKTESPSRVDEVRTRTMRLTCPAGLAGLPQLTVPLIASDGLPRGVGLLGPAGSDQALLALAEELGR